jgi:alkylhydroperoxidase family enzyme
MLIQLTTSCGLAIRQQYDEGEMVELLSAIGLFNYFNRFQ